MVAIQRATVVMALLLGAPAQATPDDQGLMAQSRAHFEAGRAFHRLGRFAEAVREFEAAYALTHLPEMLMNIGTAYWRAGDLRRACASYRRFLDEAGPTHPARGQAKQSVVELERAIAAAPPPPVERPAAPEPLVSAQASRRDLVDAPRPARSRRRTALWLGGATVVVAGVTLGLGLGLGLGLQHPSYPPTALGSVRFGQ